MDITFKFDEIKDENKHGYLLVMNGEDQWFAKTQLKIDKKRKTAEAPMDVMFNKGLVEA